MSIDTRDNVKAALGITSSDSDAKIDALLEPVTAMFELMAGVKFEAGTFTEYHYGGEQTLALRELPVDSITSVTDLATDTILAADQYEIEGATSLLRRLPRGSQWATARRSQIFPHHEATPSARWKVIYDTLGATAEVKVAFYETIKSMLVSQGGFVSEKDGDYSYSRGAEDPSSLPISARVVLDRYRLGRFI